MRLLRSLILGAALLAPLHANAASTINPTVPDTNSKLTSATVRNNFAAAYNDINNVLGKFAGTTSPVSPTNLQDWVDTSATPIYKFNFYNNHTASWIQWGSLNINTGVFSVVATSGSLAATPPITVGFSGGVATYGISLDSNFAVSGGALALSSIASGHLIANCTGGSAEPGNCSWTSFADQAVGSTNGILPYRTGGAWSTASTGTSGHALPFLDAASLTFSGVITSYAGAGTPATAQTGTLFRGVALDGSVARAQVDTFGQSGAFTCVRADGTLVSPSAVQANDKLCAFNGHGYNGSAYTSASAAASFQMFASQNWTTSANGTYARIATTANGTTTLTDQFGVEQDGGLTLGTQVGTSLGRGIINAQGIAVTSSSATLAMAVGPNGTTNPSFNVDASTASAATGLNVKANAALSGLALSVISSVANENMAIDAKGSGTITLNGSATGNIALARNTTVAGTEIITSSSSGALVVGANGLTNPALNVDASTASSATGLNIKSSAAAGGLAVSALSSGTNENLTIDAKGSGIITLNGTATGGVTVSHGLTVSSSFTATGLVTLADMANVTTAWTLFGNPSASTSATPAYFTLGSLTQKASPAGTDLILLQDQAASGQLKFATVSSIASAGSVSSIDTKTGAFTTGNGIDTTAGNVIELTAAWRTEPTTSIVTTSSHSGGFGANGSGTYTTPANVRRIRITMWGAGGGSTGSGTGAGAAGAGGNTCWNTSGAACTSPVLQSSGGGAPANSGQQASGGGGAGSAGSTQCSVFFGAGQSGGGGDALTTNGSGKIGGNNGLGFGGAASVPGGGNAGVVGLADSGGGASGASGAGVVAGVGGGGGGACVHDISSPAATYTYAVGTGGTAGAAGTSGAIGAAGGGGKISVQEFYGSS